MRRSASARVGRAPQRRGFLPGVLILAAALVLYVAFNMATAVNEPVRVATATATVWLFNIVGGQASLTGTVIAAQDAHFIVVNDCTPVGVVLLACGAILASPASLQWKAIGMAATAAGLTVLNFVRLVSLIALGVMAPDRLDSVHLLVWQPVMALSAIVAWFVWYTRVGPRGARG